MQITNEVLQKKIEAKLHLEIGCLNLLKERANSPFTVENVFKFKENPQWEMQEQIDKLEKELKGHLRHLRPAAEAEIRQEYDEEYFEQIEKCFKDCPKGLQPSDVEMEGGLLSYTPAYVDARLSVATLELSEHETEVFNALSDARQAVQSLKSALGSGLWNGELEYLTLTDKPTAEVGFEHFDQQRIRKSLKNI